MIRLSTYQKFATKQIIMDLKMAAITFNAATFYNYLFILGKEL